MTCIVGFVDKKNDCVWIGADSLGSNGYTKSVNTQHKVFRHDIFKNVVIGSTTTFRHIDLLKYSDNLFPELDFYKNEEIDHKYMVKTFVPNLINLFQNNIYNESATERGANFLLGTKNQLFEIQSDYSVLVPNRGFAAVGCGEDVAMGSLITTTTNFNFDNISPVDHILYALRAASEYCCGVAGPFVIINTMNEDVLVFDK